MRDLLHDKIDRREELASRAAEAVERVKSERMAGILEQVGPDPESVLEAIAMAVEEELTDLTTEAVRTGADGARRLRG